MPAFTDQLGRIVELQKIVRKIVSLVPSQTELLYDLGLDDEIAGITRFCVRPSQWSQQKIKVGGTKKADIQKIQAIAPDLILANKEENSREQIEELAKQFPVWLSNIASLEDALQMIESVGELTGRHQQAIEMSAKIRRQFAAFKEEVQRFQSYVTRAAYLIWRNPYMSAGGDTFINEMMKYCGFKNIFDSLPRYPEIQIDELKINSGDESGGCQLLLLSSEPYPFAQKHIDELQPHLPGTKIILADGEMFSWYGSRLLHAPDYFRKLLQKIQQ
ncbi:MAG TPA: helical backbone metal receptor [Puia sp.]|nr:helical backbone metal receptor [Puia sp.]